MFKKIGKFFTETLGNAFKSLAAKVGNFFRKIGNFFRRIFGIEEKPLDDFGGGRASGGPVQGGTPYLVGERGPELFVPGRSGNIVPNNVVNNSQPVTVTMNIQMNTDNPREAVRTLKRAFNDAVNMGQLTQSQNPFGVAYGG